MSINLSLFFFFFFLIYTNMYSFFILYIHCILTSSLSNCADSHKVDRGSLWRETKPVLPRTVQLDGMPGSDEQL